MIGTGNGSKERKILKKFEQSHEKNIEKCEKIPNCLKSIEIITENTLKDTIKPKNARLIEENG